MSRMEDVIIILAGLATLVYLVYALIFADRF